MSPVFRGIRNAFISGILLLAPVAVTVFVINFLIQSIGGPTRRFVFFFIPADPRERIWIEYGLHFVSFVIVLALITLLGWLSQRLIGRVSITLFEKFVDGVPGVRTVYNTVKQIRDTFVQQEKAVFQRVALVEFPRRGLFVLAFLTGQGKGEVQARTTEDLVNLFVPTTPNPTSGFLIMAPREDVHLLRMSVGDGMKLIISGGAVVPVYNPQTGEIEAVRATRETDGGLAYPVDKPSFGN